MSGLKTFKAYPLLTTNYLILWWVVIFSYSCKKNTEYIPKISITQYRLLGFDDL